MVIPFTFAVSCLLYLSKFHLSSIYEAHSLHYIFKSFNFVPFAAVTQVNERLCWPTRFTSTFDRYFYGPMQPIAIFFRKPVLLAACHLVFISVLIKKMFAKTLWKSRFVNYYLILKKIQLLETSLAALLFAILYRYSRVTILTTEPS